MGPPRERPRTASFCGRHRGRLAGAAAAPFRFRGGCRRPRRVPRLCADPAPGPKGGQSAGPLGRGGGLVRSYHASAGAVSRHHPPSGLIAGRPSVAIMGPRGSISVPPVLPAEVLHGPRVQLPGRDYILFAGPLAAAPQLGWAHPLGGFFPQSPNLFWPQDHAWCVASEIDLYCTLVAGSEALAQTLVGDPRLEAWRVGPADPIAFDSDQINT